MSRKFQLVAIPLSLVLGGFLWSMSADAQSVTPDMYFQDRTISVEGEVQAFIFYGNSAKVFVRPFDENAAVRMWTVVWDPGVPLNRQGITEQSLQRGDRVKVTGHPWKEPAIHIQTMMLKSITRLTDGWRWPASGPADDAAPTPTSVPKANAKPESKTPGPQAQAGGGDRTGHSDPSLAALDPNIRTMVLEEAAAAKVMCENTVTLMNLYECDCYGQETINRRLKAGTAVDRNSRDRVERFTKRPEILMMEMATLSECISTPKIEKYGREQATKLQLHPSTAISDCAGRELAVRFKQQPRAQLLNALLVQAMQACRSNPQQGAPTTPPSTPAAPPQTAINAPSSSPPKTTPPPPTEPAAGANSTSDVRRRAFSGKWEFVTRSGEVSDPYTAGHRSDTGILTVELNGDMLTLGPQTSYRVDGVERPSSYRRITNNPADPVTTGTTMAAWNGDRIVVEIRLKYPDNLRTVSARRVFSLTPDGGLLVETTGNVHLKGGPSQNLDGSTLYKRSASATQSTKASPVSPQPGNTQPPVTPPSAGTPSPSGKVTTPPPGDTLGERQAQIQKDVAEKTKALTEELRKQAQIERQGQPPSVTAPSAANQLCADASSPSQPSQTTVSVEFANVSGQPRKLYWIDFAGVRQPYGVLQPGQRAPIQTYISHRWAVTDMTDVCLATILISKDSRRLEIR